MKQLILVRHAKSVAYGYDDDFSRELTERGETDAATISDQLRKQKTTADLIISSPAKRAMQTACIFAEALNFPKDKIVSVEAIYEGITTNDFIALFHELPDHFNTVLVFGHNPTIYYLANNLMKSFNGEMPTCSAIGISFPVDHWNQLEARLGSTRFSFYARHV